MNAKVLPWITSCWRVHRVHPFLTLCARRFQDQAKQIKELKEHLSSNEHVKAPSETQASSTSESLCAEVEQAREREEPTFGGACIFSRTDACNVSGT